MYFWSNVFKCIYTLSKESHINRCFVNQKIVEKHYALLYSFYHEHISPASLHTLVLDVLYAHYGSNVMVCPCSL